MHFSSTSSLCLHLTYRPKPNFPLIHALLESETHLVYGHSQERNLTLGKKKKAMKIMPVTFAIFKSNLLLIRHNVIGNNYNSFTTYNCKHAMAYQSAIGAFEKLIYTSFLAKTHANS